MVMIRMGRKLMMRERVVSLLARKKLFSPTQLFRVRQRLFLFLRDLSKDEISTKLLQEDGEMGGDGKWFG